MTSLDDLLDELAEPHRLTPAPAFHTVTRKASRRRRRHTATAVAGASGVTGLAVIFAVAGAVLPLTGRATGSRTAQVSTAAGGFVPAGADSATVCVMNDPHPGCRTWTGADLNRFLDAVQASPDMPEPATYPCRNPAPYRNAVITLHYPARSDEQLDLNTGCGYLRDTPTLTFKHDTASVTHLVFDPN